MDKSRVQKRAARACILSFFLTVLLMPAQANLAIPTPVHVSDTSFAMPAEYVPLSSYNGGIYAQVFKAQSEGKIGDAERLASELTDSRLMGHVLAQRYLGGAYKPSSRELKSWMAQYAAHPQAEKIYALAVSHGLKDLKSPIARTEIVGLREPTMRKTKAHKGKAGEQAEWIKGLALWRKGDYADAAVRFEKVGRSDHASPWLASAGSYWAARTFKRLNNHAAAQDALARAAQHTHTFYGLLAVQELGRKPGLAWDAPEFTAAHEDLLSKYAGAQRAFALVAAGQYALAETELMGIGYGDNKELLQAALAYAAHVGLPSLSMRLAGYVSREDGSHYDSALYPMSPWEPKGGYTLDPALVHAILRQESKFVSNAVSPSGAKGLMQLMPQTAAYIAGKNGLEVVAVNDPESNLRLGQDYLSYLMRSQAVGGDMVSLLVAYNAGPGNLRKWQKTMSVEADPLLFIESIPLKETRNYVKHVLANYWIYRHRAGQDLKSLAALSQGEAAIYTDAKSSSSFYRLAFGF